MFISAFGLLDEFSPATEEVWNDYKQERLLVLTGTDYYTGLLDGLLDELLYWIDYWMDYYTGLLDGLLDGLL